MPRQFETWKKIPQFVIIFLILANTSSAIKSLSEICEISSGPNFSNIVNGDCSKKLHHPNNYFLKPTCQYTNEHLCILFFNGILVFFLFCFERNDPYYLVLIRSQQFLVRIVLPAGLSFWYICRKTWLLKFGQIVAIQN